jgi:hypothetical protein
MGLAACDMAALGPIIEDAKRLAIRFRELTGKPLGVTSEIAEYEAARLMKLSLCVAREPGYDAVGTRDGRPLHVQIKSRVVLPTSKRGQRVPAIKLKHPWDVVWLVLLDATMNPTAIWEAERPAIQAALQKPGSKSRNERGALAVEGFKAIGHIVWSRS